MLEKEMLKTPFFRDSHMHFVINGRPANRDEILMIKDKYIRNGIFSVADMGHKSGIGLEAKKMLEGDLIISTAGRAIYKRGTYGVFLGIGVSDKREIKGAIKEMAVSGAGFIKVVNSGIVSPRVSRYVTNGGFSLEELKTINEEAISAGLRMLCHANSDRAVRDAVQAGAASIEHGFFVRDETLHMMKEADVSWTPTLYALSTYGAMRSPDEKHFIERVLDSHLRSVNYAASIGVKLNIGTDSGAEGVVHGDSFFDELHFFKKAGLSLEQILSAACTEQDGIKKGNYLVVKKDFIYTRNIEAVCIEGSFR